MKGINLEVFGTIETEQNDMVQVMCDSKEGNSSVTLTIPAYDRVPAKYIIFTEHEFDQVVALVEDFKKKRGAIASTYTKEKQ